MQINLYNAHNVHCVVIVQKHSSKKSYVVYQCRSGFNLLIVDVTVRGDPNARLSWVRGRQVYNTKQLQEQGVQNTKRLTET